MASCRDCKNCIHYSLCNYEEICHYDIDNIKNAKDCSFFKDRSRFVELPCKVDDVVYRICPINDCDDCRRCSCVCNDCYDIGFVNDNAKPIRSGKVNDYNWILKCAQYFGKIYFATKEQAEQALKERGGND